MLPIAGKPVIQWIVEEALAAGADEVIVVTSRDKPALQAHFTADFVWRERLRGKTDILKAASWLDELSARVQFVFQERQLGLGHAVLQAAHILQNETEPVLVLLGDALVLGPAPCSLELVELSRKFGNASVVGLERVPQEKVSRYGIVQGTPIETDHVYRLSDLVEKPAPERAPSDLAIAGRYLLDPRILELLSHQTPGVGGEIQLTDAILQLLASTPVYGCRYLGKRYDIGNPQGYLAAQNAYDHPM